MMRRPSPEKLNALLDQAEAAIISLRIDLPELLRRREHEAMDGYPSTSMGAGSTGGGNISNPTMRTALTRPPADPVARSIDLLIQTLLDVGDLCQVIDNNRSYALSLGDAGRERTNTVRTCEACGRPVMGGKSDPWRRGLCNTDYKAYMRWSESQLDPDRQRWLRQRQKELTTLP